MLAIRCCRNCGKEFDAVVGEDNNIFCEECREVMLFFSDGRYKEEGDCGRIGEYGEYERMPVEEDLALMELVKESMSHIILDESPKLRSQKSFKGVSRSEPGRKARDGFTTLKSETHTPEVECCRSVTNSRHTMSMVRFPERGAAFLYINITAVFNYTKI